MDENPLKTPFNSEAFRRPQLRGPSAEELAEALGPFSPPDDYDFMIEFDPDVRGVAPVGSLWTLPVWRSQKRYLVVQSLLTV